MQVCRNVVEMGFFSIGAFFVSILNVCFILHKDLYIERQTQCLSAIMSFYCKDVELE